MTLIITVSTPCFTAQVAERTLSQVSGQRVIPIRDDANKLIYVRCYDAHFSIAYTGVAVVIDAETRGPIDTSTWVARELERFEACKRPLREIIDFVDRNIAGQLSAMRVQICFVLAGFNWIRQRDVWRLEAFQCNVFSGELVRTIVSVKKRKNTLLTIHGAIQAVTIQMERYLRRWISSSQFRADDPEGVVSFLVNAVREVADTKAARGTVGKSCITALLQKKDRDLITCKYHPVNKAVTFHHPLLVVGLGFVPSAMLIELENGEFAECTGEICFFGPHVPPNAQLGNDHRENR